MVIYPKQIKKNKEMCARSHDYMSSNEDAITDLFTAYPSYHVCVYYFVILSHSYYSQFLQ